MPARGSSGSEISSLKVDRETGRLHWRISSSEHAREEYGRTLCQMRHAAGMGIAKG